MSGKKARDLSGETKAWLYIEQLLDTPERQYLCTCKKDGCGKARIVSHVALVRKQIKQCVDCGKASKARVAFKGEIVKPGPQIDTGGLTVPNLTDEQRVIYDAIMRGHAETDECRDESLALIARATERGELAEELEYWTTPVSQETHQGSSLAYAIAYGMRPKYYVNRPREEGL